MKLGSNSEMSTIELIQQLYDEGYTEEEVYAVVGVRKKLQESGSITRITLSKDSFYPPMNRRLIVNRNEDKECKSI